MRLDRFGIFKEVSVVGRGWERGRWLRGSGELDYGGFVDLVRIYMFILGEMGVIVEF